MNAAPNRYDPLACLDPRIAAHGYAVAGAMFEDTTMRLLDAESRRMSARAGVVDVLGKDGCGLVTVVTGLDRHSEVAFDTARDRPLAALVTDLIGPGWVPFRSQLALPSLAASLGQWHQDQRVFADHIDDEVALTVAVPVGDPGSALRFAVRQPVPGELLDHVDVGTALAFATDDPDGDEVAPSWRAGVPLAFHGYSLHRWAQALPCPVFLFEYRSSLIRRQP